MKMNKILLLILIVTVLTGCSTKAFYNIDENEKKNIKLIKEMDSLQGFYSINSFTAVRNISWLMQYSINRISSGFKILLVPNNKTGIIEMILFDNNDAIVKRFSRNIIFENDYWVIKLPPLQIFTFDYILKKQYFMNIDSCQQKMDT